MSVDVPELLRKNAAHLDVSQISYADLRDSVLRQKKIVDHRPDGIVQLDPRNGERILYSTARARRPHDAPRSAAAAPDPASCHICAGETTAAIDLATLSSGVSFINENLYPMIYPDQPEVSPPTRAVGLHFVQWTSSRHDQNWITMPATDRITVLSRLAALERTLLSSAPEDFPLDSSWGGGEGYRGFVSIIKNSGHPVGGSIAHDHQQIAFSNIMPRRAEEHLRFERNHRLPYARFMLEKNPAKLTVRDYSGTTLLVPYFMRRPYDMQLIVVDCSKRYLHQLNNTELSAVAEGWHDAIRLIHAGLSELNRTPAYNIVMHSGPGSGLYFEFLPYSQETGGYEQLGMAIAQMTPPIAAERLRHLI